MDTKALRQKILDLAIRGKLVPQDPNDEPASVLLERIRAEKQQMVKDGKLKAKDIKNDSVIYIGEDNLPYEKFADDTEKCIQDEIPFELPEGWEWTRLGFIFSHNTGKALNKSDVNGTLLSYITTSNLYWNRFEIDNLKSMYFTDSEIDKCTVKKGDLLVCEGGDIGRSAIWSYDDDIRIQNHIHRLRPYIKICVELYYHLLYYYKLIGLINGKGIGIQGLSSNQLHSIPVPLPPLQEQYRIVEKLNEMFILIDTIDYDKTDLQSAIQLTKSKILDLAIRGKLVPQDPDDEPASVLLERIRAEKEEVIKQGKIKRDSKESVIFRGEDNSYYEKIGDTVTCIDDELPFEVPEGWEICRFSHINILISGRDLTPSEYNDEHNGIPYITGASNFSNGFVKISRWTMFPQVITEADDLLITCKGTVGEIAINHFGKAHIARQIMAIRAISSLNIDFLSLCMKYYVEKLKQSAKGLIPGISRDDILSLLLPIPSQSEQHRIIESYAATIELLQNIEKSLS